MTVEVPERELRLSAVATAHVDLTGALILENASAQRPRPRAASSMAPPSDAEALYQAHDDHDAVEKSYAAPAGIVPKHDDLAIGETRGGKKFLCWHFTHKVWLAAVVGSALAVVGVVLLVVFLAVVPAIFQSYVDKVQLSVNYMDIKTLSTDPNRNEIDLELSLRVQYDAAVGASMEDAAATLYYQDKPFGAVTLPAQEFAKGNEPFNMVIRNVAEITDAAVFRALSSALVTDEQLTIATRATVRARALGLSYGGLTLDRAFTINGFANFQDPPPRVNNMTLAECTSSAYKMRINATLDNVSQAGIGGIGALNLSVYHEQDYLGQALSVDTTIGLPRGPTHMILELTIVKSLKTAASLLGMVGGLLGGSGVQFFIRGDHPNAVATPLLRDAFAALNISTRYTEGLGKLAVNPTCDLMAILTGKR